jgi:hypothetical protein
MSPKGSVRAIVVVVVLSGIALAYLYQHWWSVRLTRAEMQLVQERRLLEEKVESLEVELAKLQSFCRLESLWMNYGAQISMNESETPDNGVKQTVSVEAIAVAGAYATSER